MSDETGGDSQSSEQKMRRALEARRGTPFTEEEWDEAKRNLVGMFRCSACRTRRRPTMIVPESESFSDPSTIGQELERIGQSLPALGTYSVPCAGALASATLPEGDSK